MRVGLVCAHASSYRHADGPPVGTRQHIARVAAELAERGHDVRLYVRRDDPALPATMNVDGYQVHQVPAGPPTPLPTAELIPYVTEFGRWLADELVGCLAARGGARALLGRWPGRRARRSGDRHPGGADVPLARHRAAAPPGRPLRRAGRADHAGARADPGGRHRRGPVQRRGRRADPDGSATQLGRVGAGRRRHRPVPPRRRGRAARTAVPHPLGRLARRRARPGGPDPGDAAGRRRRAGDRRWAAGRPVGQPRRGATAARAGRTDRRRRPGTARRRGAARPDGHLVPVGGRGRLHAALLLGRAGLAGGDGLRGAGDRLRDGRPGGRRRRRGHRPPGAPR